VLRATLLAGLLVCASGAVVAAQSVTVDLPRHAYFRGETIPLTVQATPPSPDAKLDVYLGKWLALSQVLRGESAVVRVPTGGMRVGAYVLKAVVRRGGATAAATAPVWVVRRPAADRLEVWLWGMGGGDYKYYHDHGFTITGGPEWWSWQAADRARALANLDQQLVRGTWATLGPSGGICRVELKNVDPNADDVAFKGASRGGEELFNPFSPLVEQARRANNREFMTALGWHPAVKVAFFNTEVVDRLWYDNLNREGVALTQATLGFTRDELGKPQFVAPGVLADEDRAYRFQKYTTTRGNGLTYANQQTARDVKQYRPDVWTLTDPYRGAAILGTFPGLDLVGTWTYTNNDPKLMLYYETMRALTRGTRQIPLQTVTLLNYPGWLAPQAVTASTAPEASDAERTGWMLMGPDRCKEVSWIILSRAPKILGYFFSSACNPERYNRPQDQFRVPHATSDAIKELADRVYRPYGPLLTRLQVAKRRIAVLSSQASRLYGTSPQTIGYPNEQIYYGLYTVLAMAHLNADVLFDEHVVQGALRDYDVLAMPRCEVVTKRMYDEILAFRKRGGLVIADQYLGPDIPGALKVDFDFTYRSRVNADAVAKGVTYAQWDDHLNPDTAALAPTAGVTAADDQKIMESYARRLTAALAGKVSPEVAVDTPQALVNVLERDGLKYLVLINDRRTYDDRVGKYQAIMEKLLPQTVTVTLGAAGRSVYPYDLLTHRALPTQRRGPNVSFKVDLTTLGGTLVALYPAPPARLTVTLPKTLTRGQATTATIRLTDRAGKALPGLQPLRVTVTDAAGAATEYSDYYCAAQGVLGLPLRPARNDRPGTWQVTVTDLTAGLSCRRTCVVR
jgi:hypothetical protein